MENEEIKRILGESQFIASIILDAMMMAWRREWENSSQELLSAEKNIEQLSSTYRFQFNITLNHIKAALQAVENRRIYSLINECTAALENLASELRENLKSVSFEFLNECLEQLAYMVITLSNTIKAGYKKKFDRCTEWIKATEEYLKKLESITGFRFQHVRSDIDEIVFWIGRRRPSKIDEKASSAINALFGEMREALK